MRTRIAVGMLTLLLTAGCNSGDIPTPVPNNTPTPSAQDTEPTGETGTENSATKPGDESSRNVPPSAEPPTTVAEPEQADKNDASASATNTVSGEVTTAATSQLDPDQWIAKLSDANDRDVVTRQLVALGPAAVEPLIGALKSDNWEVRASAVFCLGQLGADARPALPELKEVAKGDEVAAVRDVAAFAIDALEGQPNQP